MENLRMTYARGAGFAALLALAANVNAQGPNPNPIYNFCPTTHYNITCSNCTMNLTCDINGPTITIYGSNVKLNGNGHLTSFAQGTAVKVIGAVATISNLNISRPNGHGIHFARNYTSDYGTVENVVVAWPGLHGLTRDGSKTSVTIRNSSFDMASDGVRNNDSQYGPFRIDMFDSFTGYNLTGFRSMNGSTQSHARNQYVENVYHGVIDASAYNGGSYRESYFTWNWIGLYAANSGSRTLTLADNVGYSNSSVDCDGRHAVAMVATNNSWTTNTGCVTKP